ncbi:MAG: hypothetical protein P4L45_10560, partial [Ignavibacteriaceae bacterium]|nr:hypothetical protein [Ignavibacteriaceae bacterium]
PRIGIGNDPYIYLGMRVSDIKFKMQERLNYLQLKRNEQTSPSSENQFEAYIIRAAQKNKLIMPGFSDNLRFIHSQWRIQGIPGTQNFTDLIAIDLTTNQLVIIELKYKEDNTAFSQVAGYVNYFQRYFTNLNPFFLKLANVMGFLYKCSELASLSVIEMASYGLVAWPDKNGVTFVQKIDCPVTILNVPTELGPQHESDSPFTAKMRLHQSWYRANILKVPCGVGPTKQSNNEYGNMLKNEDGEKGLNFLDPIIFKVAKDRIAQNKGSVESFRLLNNLLSSQPMCFNLFGLMVRDLDLATQLWNSIFPKEIKIIKKILLEYSPEPNRNFLNDATAFDAFIEYVNFNDDLCFIGIETKLTEPFSQANYDGPHYRKWIFQDSPWLPESANKLSDIRHNQLWRDHLLAISMLKQSNGQYKDGKFLLIHHPLDNKCAETVAVYKLLLKDYDKSFINITLDDLINIWSRLSLSLIYSDWLNKFKIRYLDLQY